MKKVLLIIMAMLLCISLVSCTDSSSDSSEGSQTAAKPTEPTQSESAYLTQATSKPTQVTSKPTESVTDAVTPQPKPSANTTSKPTVAGKTPEPSKYTAPTAKPTQPVSAQPTPIPTSTPMEEEPMKEKQFYIKVNGKTLAADFADNSSADAFRELLRKGDLTVDMHDYGDFEKVGDIGHTLPQNNTQITTSPGDVILYLGTNITIYYDQNSWNFTKLGKIQNMTRNRMLDFFGGKGNVSVTFSLTK